VLAHIDGARTALREKFLKLLLIKLNDQCFRRRPEGLIFALRHCLLGVEENYPQRVAILFPINLKRKKLEKILKKITSNKKKITRTIF